MAPKLTEVFLREDGRIPGMPSDDPGRQLLSRVFGHIEEGINRAKLTIGESNFTSFTVQLLYSKLDELQDHTTEIFRHVVDGDEMIRWNRNVDTKAANLRARGIEPDDGDKPCQGVEDEDHLFAV